LEVLLGKNWIGKAYGKPVGVIHGGEGKRFDAFGEDICAKKKHGSK